MTKIIVALEIDEEKVKKVSGKGDLEDAITTELDWLRDSGMQVASWQFSEMNKEVTKEINKVINMGKLAEYLEEEMILEFDSDKDCMEYFNTYDSQDFKTVEEMKQYQGEYGFGVGEKWYHIDFDEALDVWENEEVAISQGVNVEKENPDRLDDKLKAAKVQIDKDVKLFVEDEICKFFIDDASYGDKNLLSIIRFGEKYANYYSEDGLVHGFGMVGPFDSLEKAEEMLKKHRPKAVEYKNVSEIKKLFYGKDKKQVLSGLRKFLNKELGKVNVESRDR